MVRFGGFLAAVLCAQLAFVNVASAGDKFFNGKDLSNFEGLMEYWSVKDGAIVGKTDGLKFNTFLCSKKNYGDFDLKLQVRLVKSVGNSGIQIRSKIADPKVFAVAGPQADMGAGYWGSLYGERFGGMMKAADPKVIAKVVKNDEFNDYEVRAQGKKITIKINGTVMVEDTFDKAPDTGIIAFQLHAGPPMEIIFRNIEFKELAK